MKDKAQACVLASFAGDALALGAHWIYDTGRIARDFGRMDTYRDPAGDSYHPTKKQGEFTHYGDQALVLLESLAASRGFDAQDFSARWQRLFDGYAGYRDQATRATLENLSQGKPFREAGSNSNDLSAAVRIAPLVYARRWDEEALVKAARVQASLTHTDALTVDAAEFLARATLRVLGGAHPAAAAQEVIRGYFRAQRWSMQCTGAWNPVRRKASLPSRPSARTATARTPCPRSSTSSAPMRETCGRPSSRTSWRAATRRPGEWPWAWCWGRTWACTPCQGNGYKA